MTTKLNLINDNGGSQEVRSLIQHLKQNVEYNQGSDCVVQNPSHGYSEVYFESVYIAKIDRKNKCIVLPISKNKTRKVKERVNRILMAFCGCQLFQNNRTGEWFIVEPGNSDKLATDNMNIPFYLDS